MKSVIIANKKGEVLLKIMQRKKGKQYSYEAIIHPKIDKEELVINAITDDNTRVWFSKIVGYLLYRK